MVASPVLKSKLASPLKKIPDGPLLIVARQYLGEHEIPGVGTNPLVANALALVGLPGFPDETAWCAAFINLCCKEAGIEGTWKPNARSFLDWGREIVSLDYALPGDVLIFWRGSPDSWQGHVTLYVSHADGKVRCLGGNQNNMVCEMEYREDHLLGIRRM